SPYVSFSFSFAVARSYALDGPAGVATQASPGYVYEVDLGAVIDPPRPLDTVREIAKNGHVHMHNGDTDLLLGIADSSMSTTLTTAVPLPGGRSQIPTVSPALKALVFAARDAEVLIPMVPSGCVVQRHSVF
ncbi:MAG: hypothetical protein KC501_32705, partial [Myxococcales bacterium]|nr:hypothetical protein [Myxococcales bacterium]